MECSPYFCLEAIERYSSIRRRQHRSERVQARRREVTMLNQLKSSLLENIQMVEQPKLFWQRIDSLFDSVDPASVSAREVELIASDLQLLMDWHYPCHIKLHLKLNWTGGRSICRLLSSHPQCFEPEQVVALLQFMNTLERQTLFSGLNSNPMLTEQLSRRLVNLLKTEVWAASIVLELLLENRLLRSFIEEEIEVILSELFKENCERPLVYFQIVAQLYHRLPGERKLSELLCQAFNNIHRITECNLFDLMKLLEWLLEKKPRLVSRLMSACQSIERGLVHKLYHQPEKLCHLLKFLSLVLECCKRRDITFQFDYRSTKLLSLSQRNHQQYQPYFSLVEKQLRNML